MTLDIRGGLKNTKLNPSPYVVFDELLSNAIDSYLMRRSREPQCEPFRASFTIKLHNRDLTGEHEDMGISCADNGAGMGDDERKAFVTKDTSFKDDLGIAGIGKCRGTGRIQFLHYFSKLALDSKFQSGGKTFRRTLLVDETVKEIEEQTFKTQEVDASESGTLVSLDGLKSDVYARLFQNRNLRIEFSAAAVKRHLMIASLHRLVSLQEYLGEFVISVISIAKAQGGREAVETDEIRRSDLPEVTATMSVDVSIQTDAQGLQKTERFTLSHYKLDENDYDLPKNVVALCAKSSPVLDVTKEYLRPVSVENNAIDEFYHLILIEGEFLDNTVNDLRDGFRIPDKKETSDLLLAGVLSLEEITDAIEPTVLDWLKPPDFDREEIVRRATEKYGVTAAMIADTAIRIHPGDTEEKVTKRVLSVYQDRVIADTSKMIDLKREITDASPHSPDFRDKINELAWRYVASLKTIDMANLSQLVVRRAAIIEVLGLAIEKELQIQKDLSDGERRKDEKIIHSIFFPMGKDTLDTKDHDIWLLNEEYQYYEYIASDKPLASIQWGDGEPLFEPDVDAELARILQANAEDNSAKRPDIAIFCKEGAAIIVEFKAPNVSLDDHVGDLMEYSQLLAAKSRGRLKRFYGYLIGTSVNPNRILGFTPFPSGNGWFSTVEVKEHTTGRRLGELYCELLFFRDVYEKANKRLQVYKDRLNLRL
jgi:hypothetical protein